MVSTRDDLYGKIYAIVQMIMRQLHQEGGYPYNPHQLKHHLMAAVEGRLVSQRGHHFDSSRVVYPLEVNYERGIAEGVGAGRYDWVHPQINSCNFFPTKRLGRALIPVEFIGFDRAVLIEEVMYGPRRMDLELCELLALGERYPQLQREFPIIGLGSIWQSPDGHSYAPCLLGGSTARGLDLYSLTGNNKFGTVHRLAVVCEEQKSLDPGTSCPLSIS